jgi:hypothetical protein
MGIFGQEILRLPVGFIVKVNSRPKICLTPYCFIAEHGAYPLALISFAFALSSLVLDRLWLSWDNYRRTRISPVRRPSYDKSNHEEGETTKIESLSVAQKLSNT